jgi:drug/metabolite transporter (DMT)-like permease
MSRQLKADTALLLVTLGWGTSFILTQNSISEMPTFNFLAIRFFLAFIISSAIFAGKMLKIGKKELKYGFLLGLLLYCTYAFQTVGLNYTTVSKSAFITGFNVVLVPVFSSMMMKVKLEKKVYFSVAAAFAGLALMTLNQSISSINRGDIYTLITAAACALYIILVGKYTSEVESVSFAIIQLGVVGLLSMITSLIAEKPIFPSDSGIWFNIVVLSVVCTSGAYIVQSIAQKFTSPTHTALIYSAEPVFAGIFAYIINGEVLGLRGIIGAGLILSAMIVSELDIKALLAPRVKKNKAL